MVKADVPDDILLRVEILYDYSRIKSEIALICHGQLFPDLAVMADDFHGLQTDFFTFTYSHSIKFTN